MSAAVVEPATVQALSLIIIFPRTIRNISLHSMIDMEEIAALAVFLASDAARHITAQHIGVYGNFETYRSPLTIQQRDVAFSEDAAA